MRRTIVTAIFAAALLSAPGAARPAAAQTSVAESDSALQQRIERRIKTDAGLKRHEVAISVSGGVATLTGTVSTPAQRQRAARLARVKGVTRVDNQLVVRSSAKATTVRAEGAAEKTKEATGEALDKTKAAIGKAIEKTKEAVTTGAEKSKDGASTAAEKGATGVSAVGGTVTDAFLLTSLKTKFAGDGALKGSDIDVDVNRHVVTLKGTVPNEAARAHAVEIARKTGGVERVVDRLTIGPAKE